MAPLGDAMFEAAQIRAGERVLDVGCGGGRTTLEAGHRVGPTGRALGIDITGELLEIARRRTSDAGADNVEFVEADAQTYPFEAGAFDVLISRHGTMFFDDPDAAFGNLGRAVRTGGRIAIVCPQDPLSSEWIAVSVGGAIPHLGPPAPGAPSVPGPFLFAEPERLVQALEAGEFRDIAVEGLVRPVPIGIDVDDVLEYVALLPQSQTVFAEGAERRMTAALAALRDALVPFIRDGRVVMNDSAWLATARR